MLRATPSCGAQPPNKKSSHGRSQTSAHQAAEPQAESRMGDPETDLQAGYDRVAENYATEFFEEL